MIEIVPNWHPIFVHFTVALLFLSVLLFLVTRIMGTGKLAEQWLVVARWSLYFGMGITLLTLASGIYAFNTVAHDAPSHAAMSDHRNWALMTVALFVAITLWSLYRDRKGKGVPMLFVIGMLVATGVLGSTAWRGGEIVYRYGLGVMSLPQTDQHQHDSSSDALRHDEAEQLGQENLHGGDARSGLEKPEKHLEVEDTTGLAEVAGTSKPVPSKKSDHYADGHSH